MECSRKKVPQINNLSELVRELRQIFDEDEVDTEYVQEVMLAYKSNPRDWRKYAHFDRHRYTRNLVDTGNGKYNLMLLAWSEGQGSGIHDHANAHCFMKVLAGTLTEVRFAWPRENEIDEHDDEMHEMQIIQETDLSDNQVTYMNDTLGLHRMENRSHALPAVSLHLYIPAYDSCHTFDQRTGHASTVKVTFYSKEGKRTPFGSGLDRTTSIISYENN